MQKGIGKNFTEDRVAGHSGILSTKFFNFVIIRLIQHSKLVPQKSGRTPTLFKVGFFNFFPHLNVFSKDFELMRST